jgi:hypothetical protein
MNLISRKPKLAIADETDVVAALHRRINEMAEDDKLDLELQIALEKTTGSVGADGAAANLAQAEAFLSGAEFNVHDKPTVSHLDVVVARRVRALALKIASSRFTQLAAERASKIWDSYFTEIAEIEKRRIMLVCELQRTNRAREKLRGKITEAGGTGYLSTDGAGFLGFGDEFAEIQWAANRLIADGICTKAEIEKARSDG